jgi:hypothetical protein
MNESSSNEQKIGLHDMKECERKRTFWFVPLWLIGIVIFKFLTGKISYLDFLVAIPFIILLPSFIFQKWLDMKISSKIRMIIQLTLGFSILPILAIVIVIKYA